LQQEEEAKRRAMKEVCPAAEEFLQIEGDVFAGKRGEDVVGYVCKVEEKGYGGALSLLVGTDKERRVLGVKILSHTETPGLGTKVTEPSFLSQFLNKRAEDIKNVSAITGATISSEAVKKGVRRCLEILEERM
jgi:electron transport complex protein RnfG